MAIKQHHNNGTHDLLCIPEEIRVKQCLGHTSLCSRYCSNHTNGQASPTHQHIASKIGYMLIGGTFHFKSRPHFMKGQAYQLWCQGRSTCEAAARDMRKAGRRCGRVVNRANGGRDAREDRDREREVQRQHKRVPPQQPEHLAHRRPATARDGFLERQMVFRGGCQSPATHLC